MSSLGFVASLLTTLLFVHLLTSFRAESQGTYLYHECRNTTTFTRNSSYGTNLRTVLSSFSSRNATYAARFDNATAGQGSDKVYGLFMCRGDLSADSCRGCVVFAVNDTLERCPNEKENTIWYDECMLRYSQRNILSRMETSPGVYMWNSQNISSDQADRFNDLVMTTMSDASDAASTSPRRFATMTANFTRFQKVYGLTQCTRDLTVNDCNSCLRQAINQLPGCCGGKVGGRVLQASCNVRFELYPFYNESGVGAPPPPRLRPPPMEPPPASKSKGDGGISTAVTIAIVIPISISVLLFLIGCCFLASRQRKKYDAFPEDNAGNDMTTVESLQFDFTTIEAATHKFSENNKLGAGGFGEVYKGKLPNGQEIAVKRLSQSSGQGAEEFKNEVVLVAKLQHRNLVRLLGFCLEGEEKILIYEFVPNKSLDYFLFDQEKQGLLDWSRRYKIIGGIARGILYLHQDSRLTIIHRDLKASNILLDSDMNPKISDFGMARIFGVDQTQGNTSRIVGTYGYMSPEYAMHGKFSMKSDIYSFGVLLLEIISGKKNSNFCQSDGIGDLVTYAWKLWRDGSPLELLDPTLGESYQRNEVMRCIHIGLLCVQEDPAERPTITSIVIMLNSYSVTLPVPQQPGFFLRSRGRSGGNSRGPDSDQSTSKSINYSVDDASITDLYPR